MAWRRRREIPARVLPWLLGVTRRALADQRRSIRRRLGLVDRVVLHRVEPPAGDPADEVTERAVVLAALGELPPRDRELLELIAWDGLCSADAAVVVGCSEGAFAVRLSRARRRLADALARHDDTSTPRRPSSYLSQETT